MLAVPVPCRRALDEGEEDEDDGGENAQDNRGQNGMGKPAANGAEGASAHGLKPGLASPVALSGPEPVPAPVAQQAAVMLTPAGSLEAWPSIMRRQSEAGHAPGSVRATLGEAVAEAKEGGRAAHRQTELREGAGKPSKGQAEEEDASRRAYFGPDQGSAIKVCSPWVCSPWVCCALPHGPCGSSREGQNKNKKNSSRSTWVAVARETCAP